MKSFLIYFLVMLASVVVAQTPPAAQKPLDKDQVMTLVTAGMDNAQLAKKVQDLGINFEPTDDYLEALRKAGAQDVLIYALRATRHDPMNQQQVMKLVAGGVPSERATVLVKQRGVDFVPDEKYIETLRVAGADEALIAAVREASAVLPGEVVLSTSANADVYLDGSLKGRANSGGQLIVEKVEPGPHALRVSLAMKKDYAGSITVAPGVTNKIAAPLTDLPGKIVVSSTPGAEIFLDGASRGKSDASGKLVLTDLTPGSHQLRVTAQGKKDFQQTVGVSDGQEIQVYARLEDQEGTIRVRATPGAKAYLDNKNPLIVYGNGEVTFGYVTPGSHSMRVVAEGQPEFRGGVYVYAGQQATVDAPRAEPGASSTGKRIDRFFRTMEPYQEFWYYLRFFPDSTVVMYGSKGSLADVEKGILEMKSKGQAYVYQMHGSTIRWSANGFLSGTDCTASLRGNKVYYESVDLSDGHRAQDTYQEVSTEPAPIGHHHE